MSESNQMLAQVVAGLVRSGQLERERVCKVLHDEVGQVISAVGLQIELLRLDFEGQAPGIASRTAEIQRMLDSALTPLRRLVTELHPASKPKTDGGGRRAI